MTSSLITFRNSVLTTLDADTRLNGVHIYAHGGDFNLAELRDWARQLPAVVVAVTHVDMEIEAGLPIAHVLCAAMVVTNDKPGVPRDQKALTLVDALSQILCRFPNQDWGLVNVGAPYDVKAVNVYSQKIQADGVAMWAVAWRQQVELEPFTALADDLVSFSSKWDLSPRDNDAPIGTPADPQPLAAALEAEDLVDGLDE